MTAIRRAWLWLRPQTERSWFWLGAAGGVAYGTWTWFRVAALLLGLSYFAHRAWSAWSNG